MVQIKSESDRLDYPVSIVKGNKKKILKIASIRDVLNMMVLDKDIIEHTNKIRSTKGEEQKKLKNDTDAFLVGEFAPTREDANIKKYPPLMAFDIDKIPHQQEYKSIFESLQECEFTFLAFPSVRGKGIRFIVCHDAPQSDHRQAYHQIAKHYADHLNIALSSESTKHCHIDLKCCNISRHWFLGHADEEEIHHNNDSEIFTYIKEERTPAPSGDSGSSPDSIKKEDKIQVLKLIASDQAPFENGRNTHTYNFVKLMAENGITQSDALDEVLELQEEGFTAHEIRGVVVRTYRRLKRSDKIGKYNDVQMMAFIKHVDFKNEDIKNQIEAIISSYPEIEEEAEKKKPNKFELALEFIRSNYKLERNNVTRFVEDSGERMTEHDMNSVYIDLKYSAHKINKNDTFALINSNRVPSYNPFDRFVEDRHHYSSNGNILKIAQSIQTTTGMNTGRSDFTEIFFAKWYVGMIASAFAPNVNPLLLVLCGGQNTGKTEFFRRLLPDELRPYMAESKLDEGKDSEIMMTDKLLILDDEYGGKSKRDSKRLKELISKDYFTVRPAYARTSERLRRIATLCGTSNEYNVLSDITGNRRVIPVKVTDIDKELYNSVDKVALFMEGYRTFKAWEANKLWQLSKPEIVFLNRSTEDFEQISAEREMFFKYFKIPPSKDVESAIFITTSGIIEHIQSKNNLRLSLRKMGTELRGIGLERENGKGEDSNVKGYYLIKKGHNQSHNPTF